MVFRLDVHRPHRSLSNFSLSTWCAALRSSLPWRSHHQSIGPRHGLGLGFLASWFPEQGKASNQPSEQEVGYLD